MATLPPRIILRLKALPGTGTLLTLSGLASTSPFTGCKEIKIGALSPDLFWIHAGKGCCLVRTHPNTASLNVAKVVGNQNAKK